VKGNEGGPVQFVDPEVASVDKFRPELDLPMADVQETDRLETAAMQLFRANVFMGAEVIVRAANGEPISRLQSDNAKYIVERVLGPIKGPANDYVEEWLKDIRNTPTSKVE